jgi:hypothetical protein
MPSKISYLTLKQISISRKEKISQLKYDNFKLKKKIKLYELYNLIYNIFINIFISLFLVYFSATIYSLIRKYIFQKN